MKKNQFIFVLAIVLVGMVLTGIQILSTPRLLVMLVVGLMLIFVSLQLGSSRWRVIRNIGLFSGSLLVLLAGFSTDGIWISFFVMMAYLLFWGKRLASYRWWASTSLFSDDSYIAVKTTEPMHRFEKEQYTWLGTQRIGQETFEWDDINISQLAGDTIIDLGNTVLPQQENVIVVRKGIGRVRIIVPYGVGIMIQHNSFIGQLTFQGETHELKNQTVKCYSNDYDTSVKKIKIISSIVIGNVEVIVS